MKKALLVLTIVAMFSGYAWAADRYWDGDGAGTQDGGVGTWNIANLRWSTDEGTTFTGWTNGDSAVFDDVAATVTVSGTVIVQNITFSPTPSANYTLTGGTINFSGGSTITVNTTGTTSSSLTSLYTGTGPITKMGGGRLELNNASNTLSGGYIINQGFINLAAANRLGTGAALPGTLDADWFTFGGGGLTSSNAAAQDLGATRGVTLAGKAWFGASAASNPVTISAPITGTGDIIVANSTSVAVNGGSASPLNSTFGSGGILILTNTSGTNPNNWVGDAQISAGTLRTGASEVIPNTAIVHLTLAGVQFDLATNNTTETVKSVSGTAGTIALGATGKLILDNPTGQTYTSVFSSTATTAQVVKNGSGAISLSGSSSGFSGEMVLNTGTIAVGGNNSLGSAAGAQFTINGGKLSNMNASGRTMSANLAVNMVGDFTVDDSIAQLTPVDGGVISFGGVNTIKGGNRTITVSATGGNLSLLTFSSAVGEDAAGRGIIKKGNATMSLNAVNTYSGDTQIDAGTINVDGDGTLGNAAGTLKMNGGRLNVTASRNNTTDPIANPINVTDNSAITTTSTAATVQTNLSNNSISGTSGKSLTFRNDAAAGTGAFQPRFSGSGFTLASDVVLAPGSVDVLRTVELNSFNGTGTSQTFSGTISGNGSYTRNASTAAGGGDTILTGNNTYSGGTNVSRGTVYANNTTGSATGTGAVTVGANGVLAGTGAVSGAVTVNAGGIVSPGASIESLGASGGVTFNAGTFFNYEINGTLVAADLLNSLGGSVVLDTTGLGVTLNSSDLAPAPLGVADGTKFTMIAYNGNANIGQFVGIADLSIVVIGGQDYRIRYKDTNPGGNFASETTPHLASDRFVTLTAVPELGSFITMGLVGCCAIGAVRFGKRYGFKAISL